VLQVKSRQHHRQARARSLGHAPVVAGCRHARRTSSTSGRWQTMAAHSAATRTVRDEPPPARTSVAVARDHRDGRDHHRRGDTRDEPAGSRRGCRWWPRSRAHHSRAGLVPAVARPRAPLAAPQRRRVRPPPLRHLPHPRCDRASLRAASPLLGHMAGAGGPSGLTPGRAPPPAGCSRAAPPRRRHRGS
jgi:hypothetical protein